MSPSTGARRRRANLSWDAPGRQPAAAEGRSALVESAALRELRAVMASHVNQYGFVPFSLRVDLLDRMINFEIADDPLYRGVEVQGFDDPIHGVGIVVFFERASDNKVDVYFEKGLSLDPSSYAVGGGLGEWREAEFEVARFSMSDVGVDVEVRFADAAGRPIEIAVADRLRKSRRWAAFLAPGGAAIQAPKSMPLWWMPRFDLLRRTGSRPTVRFDGRAASPGRLPGEWFLRRRLIKIAWGVFVVEINPDGEDSANTASEVVFAEGAVPRVLAEAGAHSTELRFDPPFPDLTGKVAAESGKWTLAINRESIIGGQWRVSPQGQDVAVELQVTQGWRPNRLPLLMHVVTRVVPTFRKWPTTYRWHSKVTPGERPEAEGHWERVGDERGEAYRSFTKSAANSRN